MNDPNLVQRAEQLMAARRFAEVIALVEPVAERARLAPLWSMLAMARINTGRGDLACDPLLQAARLDGEGGRAWLNAATMLIESERIQEACDAVERAMDMGMKPPEALWIYGRALHALDRLEEAEAAFHGAIAMRPNFPQAHHELAQLIWMRTADLAQSRQFLDGYLALQPDDLVISGIRARLMFSAGLRDEANAEMERLVAHMPSGPQREIAIAGIATYRQDYAGAEAAAERAAAMGGEEGAALIALAKAQLGQGAGDRLLKTAEKMLERNRWSQQAIGYSATAFRIMNDPRGDAYRDYGTLVQAFDIDVPKGWSSREAYLADLAAALQTLHPFESHPFEQSVRHGSQTTQSLVTSRDPVIAAFFRAIDGPIQSYLKRLGRGGDPLRARNTGNYEIKSCWSIWLKSGGFHLDHVHPAGWVSSACYVALPSVVEDAESKQGWIRFGRPPIQPPGGLDAEYYVQPRPGRVVLFPAWMWHGTVPFNTDERRLTVAFDVQPA